MLALFAPLGSFAAAERQSFANAIRTVNTVRAWSPAHHRYFPRSDRAEIVDTLLALSRSGLPNDVIVGHVLPATFEAPWATSFDGCPSQGQPSKEDPTKSLGTIRHQHMRRRLDVLTEGY